MSYLNCPGCSHKFISEPHKKKYQCPKCDTISKVSGRLNLKTNKIYPDSVYPHYLSCLIPGSEVRRRQKH